MDDLLKDSNACTEPCFNMRNRLMRLLWAAAYVLLFRPSPAPLHAWRAMLLRLYGAKTGKGCHIYPGVKIWAPWNMELGDYVCLANDVICSSMARIRIGRKAVISQGARLYTGTHDYEDPKFRLILKSIEIGAGSWIAAEAFVMPGVRIGDGAVIGARSVVTGDVPAWTVYAGNPAKSVKIRTIKDR